MPEKKELRVAMIGYKFMGKAHSHAYRDLPFYFDLGVKPVQQVLCGRDEASVKETAERFGFKEWATDWRKVIEREDIDVVDIVTPNHMHAEIAIAAAKAGKHIICEKPLAMNMQQSEEMLKAVQQSGVTAMLCHNYRFVPAVMYAKRLIEEGRLGRIFHVRATYLQDWGMDDGGSFVRSWRYSKEFAGSGAHGDVASHILDLARFLVGEVGEVVGALETFKSQREHVGEVQQVEIDDASIFLAKFQNGALGTFEATRFAKGNRNGNRFEINGEKGAIRWDLENLNLLQVYLDDETGVEGFKTVHVTGGTHPYGENYWPAGLSVGYEHSFINLFYDFFKALETGGKPKPDFEDGVMNQKVLDAVEKSSIEKKWTEV